MKAILTIGISCSGKSTWAESFTLNHVGWININRDDIRFEYFCDGERNWGKYKWKHEKAVTKMCNDDIHWATLKDMNIIVSDTNLNPKYRNLLIERLEDYGYDVEIKEFPVDLEEAYKRDRLRPNGVGQEVIYRQYLQWLDYKEFKKYEPDPFLPNCVTVDVDGTIARMKDRGPFDWSEVGNDEPIWEVMDVVDGLHKQGYTIVFLSGRDGSCYDATYKWLKDYFDFSINLYMRSEGDCRKDYEIKLELFWKYVANNFNVKMVVDDRKQVLENLWGPLGIKIINVGKLHERF